MVLVDVTLRMFGWLVAVVAAGAALRGQELAAAALGGVAVLAVSTGRDLRYRRLARQLDRWAATDIEVDRHRRLDP